ncbi:hypothetical protein LZ554_003908 [Drepanopeziza brunnea f. sp. 'monogermtubi']|nr:hypothetical protein LZ554_003908 [Drepanopeziza brunnea f. sp. 'monogermtubi']
MPQACRFWLQGNCRHGNNCRFLHENPKSNSNSNPNQQPVNGNRFAALQDNPNTRNYNNGYRNRAPPASTLPYSLDKNAIRVDLISERPQWILSAYGPGRAAPAQLFGGPIREQSFEEMRLLHYVAAAAGNPQQAVRDAEQLFQSAEQQIQNAVNNIDGAINFVIAAEKDHPNRIDIVNESQAARPGSQMNPLSNQSAFQQAANVPFGGAIQQPAGQAFGSPSAFGIPPSAPAFGAPTNLGGSGGFGQPSALGQKPNVFGGTTQLGSGGAFGQPSALGQKANPFGAPSSNTTAAPFSAFASSPNPFGQKQPESTPFGSSPFGASQPPVSNPLGAPSLPVEANPFGQPFNQGPTPTANPFGAGTPAFGASTAENIAFGAPSPAKNPFGDRPPSSGNINPFMGRTSNEPQNLAAPNPFSNPVSGPPVPLNPFKQPLPAGPPPATGIRSGAPPGPISANAEMGAKHPDIGTYSTRNKGTNRLLTFKGHKVIYKGDIPPTEGKPAVIGTPGFTDANGNWERIWFPDGPPVFNKDTAMHDSMYDEALEVAYKHAKATGAFEGGKMPLLPPKREWCNWDF